MSYEETLKGMGLIIEPIELDNGKFALATRVGDLIFTSGQISSWDGKDIKGKVGADVSVAEAYEAARMCALNNLRAIRSLVGSLDDIEQFVKVLGMVNVAPDFDDTPAVVNGCSDLLREVFGPAGQHSRSAVGMTIPFNWAVEVEMVVKVR
ncbi:enamine deaminase RidA (YjgF/YER057c/UK114 family) [Hamadaea flava]|uniref:RidA family protein n=1 Tax=Hamadaea flava TaxID=1742688 RepID=A0ABV8M122_9ACTN|nr:RidA family protein [Hamadaea flava]MCP2322063.1 enamine deaminase RidA (YjgF/YER057c/UK114 family) [Hamadaea flava]